MNELTTNSLIALWVVPILQWAKKSDAPWLRWINGNTTMAVSAGVAILTALGLHMTYDHATGAFAITGSVSALMHAFTQFTLQHTGHKGYVALEAISDFSKKFDQFSAYQVTQTKAQNVALDVIKAKEDCES